MSSLLSDTVLKEGTVVAGYVTVIKYTIIGVILMSVVAAFIFQQKGLAVAGKGFETTLLNLFEAPANAIKNIFIAIANLVWTTLQNIGNGIYNGAKGVGTDVTRYLH